MKREKLHSVMEASKIFGVSCYTVYRWLNSGKLKGYKLAGSKWRISEEHIDELFKSGMKIEEVDV